MTAVRASVTVNKNEDGSGEKMAKAVFIFISALVDFLLSTAESVSTLTH